MWYQTTFFPVIIDFEHCSDEAEFRQAAYLKIDRSIPSFAVMPLNGSIIVAPTSNPSDIAMSVITTNTMLAIAVR